MSPNPEGHMSVLRKLLWIDCGAAFVAGLAVLALAGWLSRLYALPRGLLVVMGGVNLAYGAFSFSLARRARRPPLLIAALVAANTTWALLCGLAAARLVGTASGFGLAHLVGEAIFVGALAALEWNQRERLRTAA
jgi:hypothetical protein